MARDRRQRGVRVGPVAPSHGSSAAPSRSQIRVQNRQDRSWIARISGDRVSRGPRNARSWAARPAAGCGRSQPTYLARCDRAHARDRGRRGLDAATGGSEEKSGEDPLAGGPPPYAPVRQDDGSPNAERDAPPWRRARRSPPPGQGAASRDTQAHSGRHRSSDQRRTRHSAIMRGAPNSYMVADGAALLTDRRKTGAANSPVNSGCLRKPRFSTGLFGRR